MTPVLELVQQSDPPPQLIKDRRRWEQEIEMMKTRLEQGEGEQTTPVRPPDEPPPLPRNAPLIKLPLLPTLLFNLMIVTGLAFVLPPPVSLPCVSPLASALGEFVILLLLFHLIWRHLGPVIRGPVIKGVGDKVALGPIAVPVKVLASLSDALHLWVLSDRVLWVVVIALSLAAGALGLSPLSPFRIAETCPIIQSFLVRYADGSTETFAPGSLVEVPAYTQVQVKAVITDQPDVSCTWSAMNGALLPAQRCTTIYSPPLEGNQDTLGVLTQSPCKTWQAFAGLHISIVKVRPQP